MVDYDPSGDVYHPNEITAAGMLIDRDIDLRTKDTLTDTQDVSIVKLFLYDSYLPLAHQTQFVESGVKLAKQAAATGRSEESRSSYAIVKSITDGCVAVAATRTDKAARWINQSVQHVSQLEELRQRDPVAYDTTFVQVKRALNMDHFKSERVASKQTKVAAKAHTNKTQNKRQKTAGVDTTNAVLGLVAISKLRTEHLAAVRLELDTWDVAYEQTDGIRRLGHLLHKHEVARVADCGDDNAKKHAANKAFKPLSTANFD